MDTLVTAVLMAADYFIEQIFAFVNSDTEGNLDKKIAFIG
jgi:hypothetical protein